MASRSDNELVRCSLAGDQDAFVALIKRHDQPLAALTRRYVRDYHAAEDVLQETLLRAWMSLGQLRDARKFRAWLLQVARNRCRDYLKSAQRRYEPTEDGWALRRTARKGFGSTRRSLCMMRSRPECSA